MKIVTYVLAALLVAALGAAALFYFQTYQPLETDYARMKAGLPALDKAKAELNKYKEKEAQDKQETAWIYPAAEELSKGLAEEIQAGKAEVTTIGRTIVINIAESKLFTPRSVTFAKDSPPLLQKLAGLLSSKSLNGKTITIANATDDIPAQGKGKKRIPPKEARAVASERSIWLIKFLEQHNISHDVLIAAALPQKAPDLGFKIKDHKTVIMIESLPAVPAGAVQPKPVTTAASKPPEKNAASPVAQPAQQVQPQPKTIPLKPAQPKAN